MTYEDLINDIVFKSEGCQEEAEIPEEIFDELEVEYEDL